MLTTLAGGQEMFEFSNGQREKHFPDGRKEILFPDGTLTQVDPGSVELALAQDSGNVYRVRWAAGGGVEVAGKAVL